MRRGVVACAALLAGAGCGRVGFSPPGSELPAGDAAVDDAPIGDDAIDASAGMPMIIDTAASTSETAMGLDMSGAIPGETVVLVAVLIGSDCVLDVNVTTVDTIALDGVALTRVDSILGTPCGSNVTRTEVWSISNPAPGPGTITADLPGLARTVHVLGALVVGVNAAMPVRDSVTASGDGDVGTAVVASAPGDLVVSFVGQGDFIEMPTTGTPLLVQNNTASRTLDNSAASWQIATGATTSTSWQFEDPDEWQIISVALRPR